MLSHISPSSFLAPSTSLFRFSFALPSRLRHRVLVVAIALAGLTTCLASAPARADSAPTNCDQVASPEGSDSGTGSAVAPLRTAQELVKALAPGQVGCLRTGTYAGGLRFDHGGTSTAPIVLRSYPGERALITGRIYVPSGSNYVTVADLSLDGNHQPGSETLPSPTINANHVTFESDDVTNDHTEICFDVGSSTWGVADSTVISGNHIHDCGLLPSRNQDHGIYVQDATNIHIVDNLIDHNTDRGIQLYPSSTGAVITDNVISENGEGILFSGEGGVASNDNIVEHNLIVNSLIRSDIESWYPSGNPHGVGNLAQNNCVSTRGIDPSDGGFSAQGNIIVSSSELIATGNGGYRPAAGSACAGMVPELVKGLGVEGAPLGGAPTPVGKEPGGGSTATPRQEAPASGSTPTSTQEAPVDGSPTPIGKALGRGSSSTGTPKHHKHRGATRKTRRAAKAARTGHAPLRRTSRVKRARPALRHHRS
jgi:parallel beta-helix repeat protein